MRKSTLFLISIGCFILALISYYSIQLYAQQKAKQEFAQYLKNNQPYFSPTEVIRQFVQLSAQGKEDEIKLFITEVPISAWIGCKEEWNSEKKLKWVKEHSKIDGFLDYFANYTKVSILNMNQVQFETEQIYENEAAVEFSYALRLSEPLKLRALLAKNSQGWKIFKIEFGEQFKKLPWMKNETYAKPRQNCSQEKLRNLEQKDDEGIILLEIEPDK